jgi:hypothetical protein
LSIAQFANGPKRSMGHVLGAKKGLFVIRGRRAARARAAAPVESCQSLPKRSLWSCLGPLLVVCNRLQRMRPGSGHNRPILSSNISSLRPTKPRITWQWLPEPRRAPRIGACGVGDYPTPGPSPRESASRSTFEKSKQFGPMAPRSRQKRQLPEGPQ